MRTANLHVEMSDALPHSTPSDTGEPLDRDAADLAGFGYRQQLRRTMGAFSSFAIAFSLISIITGIFANFSFGYRQVGSSILWSWTLVALGQFLVALVLADLSSRIPLSGYGYQWSTRLVNAHYGYLVGWLLLMQFVTGFPGVCHALASVTCAWFLDGPTASMWVPWVAVAIVTFTAAIHLFGIRLVSLINDAGVVAEILGAVAVTIALWVVFFQLAPTDTQPIVAEATAQSGISAFALSLLMGAWCLTGFEAAADMAEETHRPRWTVPRVMLLAEVGSSVLGLLLLAGLTLNIDRSILDRHSENLVVTVLGERLGSNWMPLVMLVVSVSILACAVASMAATTRLVFSLARDNMLPFSGQLKAVNPFWRTPASAIVMVWCLSTLVILGLRRLEIITSVSAAAGFTGYAGIIFASLRARGDAGGFTLGRWQAPVRLAALAWTLIVVLALTIPEADSTPGAIRHLAAKSTLTVGAIGLALYFGLIRSRIIRGKAGPPPIVGPPGG